MKVILLLMTFLLNLLVAQPIKMFTEHYPPYNMKVAGELQGIAVDVLEEILKEINSQQTKKDVKLTNWSRAYSIAQKVPNSMVFSTTRTKTREDLFKWVGPITKTSVGVVAPKKHNFKINTMADFNKYKIGAVLKDVGEQFLLSNGVNKKNIQHVNGQDAINLSFTKMEKGRIDMFAYNTNVAFTNAKMKGFDTSKYEIIYTFSNSEIYFAFNKKTDDAIIKQWQMALDTIKKNGTYDNIMKKYK